MAKVTGIGGVFLKCKGDSKALAAWYAAHLGIPLESWAARSCVGPTTRRRMAG